MDNNYCTRIKLLCYLLFAIMIVYFVNASSCKAGSFGNLDNATELTTGSDIIKKELIYWRKKRNRPDVL